LLPIIMKAMNRLRRRMRRTKRKQKRARAAKIADKYRSRGQLINFNRVLAL